MPTYKITDPTTGRKLRITGDSPPTEQELNDIFAKAQPSVITDTRQLMATPADKLRNNPQAQQAAVEQAQQKAFGSQPMGDKFLAGMGRFAYGAVPGVPNKDELKSFDTSSKGDAIAAMGKIAPEMAITMAGGGALGNALKVAKIASPAVRALASGASYGAPSTVLHQSQNLAEGKGLDPTGAALEMGLSTILPLAGNKVGSALKGAGRQIAQTALKSNTKISGQKILSPEQAETFLSKFGSLRGLKTSDELISKTHEVLSGQFDELINKVAAGKSVNLRGSLAVAEKEIDALAKDAGINLSQVPAIKATLQGFREDIKGITNKQGWSKFPTAQAFKTKTLDDVANYAKKSPGQFSPELDSKAIAARTARKALANQMANIEPQLAPLNKQFQEMAQIEPFIGNAIERGQANRGRSMQDIAALTGGVLGVGGAAATDHTEYAPLALLPYLLSRGQKSTGLATALFRQGKSLADQPSWLRNLLLQMGRTGMDEARNGQ